MDRIPAGRNEFFVVSYNIHSCVGADSVYNLERISELLLASNKSPPTIVCLQEVENNSALQKTRVWSKQHNDNQPKRIAEYLKFEHYKFAPAINSVCTSAYHEIHDRPECGNGEFGIAVLSKYPIIRSISFTYSRFGKKTLRNALACLIQLPMNNVNSSRGASSQIWVVNTHLGVQYAGREQYEQAIELKRFIEDKIIDSEKKNNDNSDLIKGIILCGDFNSLPFFSSVKVIKSINNRRIVDTWEETVQREGKSGYGNTFPSVGIPLLESCCSCIHFPIFRLDYIFLINNRRLQSSSNGKNDADSSIQLKYTMVVKPDNKCTIELLKASDHIPIYSAFAYS